jgi:hypothetical protein
LFSPYHPSDSKNSQRQGAADLFPVHVSSMRTAFLSRWRLQRIIPLWSTMEIEGGTMAWPWQVESLFFDRNELAAEKYFLL